MATSHSMVRQWVAARDPRGAHVMMAAATIRDNVDNMLCRLMGTKCEAQHSFVLLPQQTGARICDPSRVCGDGFCSLQKIFA